MKPEDPQNKLHRRETWRALEKLFEEGKVKAIGVSNYTIEHLEELLQSNPKVIPSVNQVEFHPWFYQKELLEYCKSKGIFLQAYSSLARLKFSDPEIERMAKKYNKTQSQILLRWGDQHEVGLIPKSSNPERILENIQIYDFTIDENDMKILDNFVQKDKTCWDPRTVK